MKLGRTNGFLLLVCQRFKQRVGASYIGWEPGWRKAGA
jgi:hypothetical protein